jgi:hypothetical protein
MRIAYMGLEPYESRYTFQLEKWNEAEFQRLGVGYDLIRGTDISGGVINTGSVLDAYGRTHFSLTQTATLVLQLAQGKYSQDDVIFYEDMFTPGIEALPYIFSQIGISERPRVFVRCLAQTIDPDDFTHRMGMFDWMRKYEELCDNFVDGILVASEEMVANLRITGFKSPIYVTGLPFGKAEVQSRILTPLPLKMRTGQVVFASRWDSEKQPYFFMEVVREAQRIYPMNVAILTGCKGLRSDNHKAVREALRMRSEGLLDIVTGLTKDAYYRCLGNARVLFNCSLQDWVSNTVSEADALGTQTLFPAYRSFPETFANSAEHMYLPWSVEDAVRKLIHLVHHCDQKVGQISDYQDKSIERTIEVFKKGEVSPWYRGKRNYRHHVSIPKYEAKK